MSLCDVVFVTLVKTLPSSHRLIPIHCKLPLTKRSDARNTFKTTRKRQQGMERREEGKEKKGSRRPLGLTVDGDLLRLIRSAIARPVYDTVRAGNVKGHAADDVVQHGKVRSADKAVGCGRRRKADSVSSDRAALVRESMISFDCHLRRLFLLFLALWRTSWYVEDRPRPLVLVCGRSG